MLEIVFRNIINRNAGVGGDIQECVVDGEAGKRTALTNAIGRIPAFSAGEPCEKNKDDSERATKTHSNPGFLMFVFSSQ